MKTIIASLLFVTWFANPAAAQSQRMKATGDCPAKTCTDHSYDQAYTAPNQAFTDAYTQKPMKDCPAATCTDHSYDEAYSATNHYDLAPKRRRTVQQPVLPPDTWIRMKDGENSYSMNEYIYYGRGTTGINRPTAYEGDNAPTYDGFEKNAYRNMRANNFSEPLPPNNGD